LSIFFLLADIESQWFRIVYWMKLEKALTLVHLLSSIELSRKIPDTLFAREKGLKGSTI